MIHITSSEDIPDLKGNKIVGQFKLENSKIIFTGSNNIVYFDGFSTLKRSNIFFHGNNSLLYICKNTILININLHHNQVAFFGKDIYTNGCLNINLSEQKHFFIGDDCLLSFGIFIRNADPHLIYDSASFMRINNSKSIYIGDHVWIGQNALILKNTQIGSGSIIGAMSLVSHKKVASNCVYAGNPAQKIKENIFFTKDCVHGYLSEETQKHNQYKDDRFIYEYDSAFESYFDFLDENFTSIKNAEEKIYFIKAHICEIQNKNRFYIKN